MKTLKSWLLLSSVCLALPVSQVRAGQAQGGQTTQTKDLWGASGGVSLAGGDYSASFSMGEQTAGNEPSNHSEDIPSGYYAGRLGNWQPLTVVRVQAQNIGPLSNDVQLGVPVQSQLEIDLSDLVQSPSVSTGLNLTLMQDHLGDSQTTPVTFQYTYAPSGQSILINPTTAWLGNTLYDLAISSGIQNLDGFPLATVAHFRFITVLDPSQQNVVLHPVDAGTAQAAGNARAFGTEGSPLRVSLAPQSLSGYSMVLVNPDPLHAPLQVDPKAITDANQKVSVSGGGYSIPIAMQEIVAYNLQGQPTTALSAPAQVSWPYSAQGGIVSGQPTTIRSQTLSLWVLDQDHHLWVKMPGSTSDTQADVVSTTIPRLSVFALMGQSDGNASNVYVFPIPWRPHGPNSGTGSGQTGTEAGGMTFSNLPSECRIRIYTLSGDLVRDLHHSDTTGPTGQESWDGLTSGGSHAASGVYLWRVESSVDSKNGKLMIIR